MSTSHRLKEKYDKSNSLSLHNGDEGSAARTRPFSFEEIMLRRKKKSLSEDVKEGVFEAEITSKEGTKDSFHSFESESERHVGEETIKISSRKKEKFTSVNTKFEEYHLKGKDRGTRELESKLKARPNSYTSTETKGGRNNKQIHSMGEHDKQEDRKDKKIHGRREHDKQEGRKDKQIHGRKEHDKYLTDYTQNEARKKHSKDSTGKESHATLSRGKSEKESKRKYQNGDNEKAEDRNAAKKLDTGRHYGTDISGRNNRKEQSKSHFEDPKLKRGRSRSRDRVDRNKRSRSPSLGARKHASYKAYREVTSHHPKDRSEKQHYVERTKLSSNGSNSHHRRHDGPTSGLGGYSPRKRISEAAARTPPPNHSSEKKSAKWDLPPAGTENILSGSVPSNLQSSNSTVSTSVLELATAAPVASVTRELPFGAFAASLSTKRFATIDSIQLTQATRPMRRLYIENIPSSTSEKALVDWLNDLLLSSGVNHIQGTQPCISCIINHDKGQALVEFLTPEDASSALSFDERSISGSILKIRRPKDFVEVATGDQEKSVAAVDTITDVVKDSPNKIFIGGISKALSSKMLMEIVSAFGPLKAYHFEVNDNLDEPCAFLEYIDQSVTIKACAGLNGMKLGGKVLTVVQAIHSATSLENTGSSALYEIPELAKPLLKQPTQVLKLKNVFNIADFSSLSEPEVEEVVEDVRLECARFGNVKSVNVVRQGSSQTTGTETSKLNNNAQTAGLEQKSRCEDKKTEAENLVEHMDDELSGIQAVEFASDVKELKEDEVAENNCTDDSKPNDVLHEKSTQTDQLHIDMKVQVLGCENVTSTISELPNSQNSPRELSEHDGDKVASTVPMDADYSEKNVKPEDNSNLGDADSNKQGRSAELNGIINTESDAKETDGVQEPDFDLGNIFEVGCVFVEFRRTEAACMAAHCLHGRVFDDRIVTVEYVALDHYKAKFPK